jgi:hypothetical protein
MDVNDDKTKRQKEKIEEALEDLVEKSSKYSPDSEELEAAKTNRALAEKKLVDSRGPEQSVDVDQKSDK